LLCLLTYDYNLLFVELNLLLSDNSFACCNIIICFLVARCGFVRLQVKKKKIAFVPFINVDGQKFIPKGGILDFLNKSDHKRFKITYISDCRDINNISDCRDINNISDCSDISDIKKFDESNLVKGSCKKYVLK
jgi:hypothetical protein